MDAKTQEFLQKLKDSGNYNDNYSYSKVLYTGTKNKITIIDENGFEHVQLPYGHLNGKQLGYVSVVDKNKYFEYNSRLIHGNKYDYSKVNYVNNQTNVLITCPYRGDFLITPNKHLSGRGYPDKFNVKFSKEEFIEKSNKIHGNKYDYSKVVYTNSQSNVIIIDENGFEHVQLPHGHLNGKALTISSVIDKNKYFIYKATLVHGNKYDYSKVNYINSSKKIIIICPIHGEFEQLPYGHLKGKGCQDCIGNKKSSTEYFIAQAKEIYGDRYDYSKVNYVNNHTNVIIIDENGFEHLQSPISHLQGKKINIESVINVNEYIIHKFKMVHGNKYDYSKVNYTGVFNNVIIIDENGFEFLQTPRKHLNSNGLTTRSVVDKNIYFITKAIEIHGNRYDYSKVNYVKNDTKVIIKCLTHKFEFEQTPSSHLCGSGCPICNRGINKSYKLKLINDLSESDLLTMDPVELFTIINQGKLPQEFNRLTATDANSDERITTLRELQEQFEEESEETNDIISDDIINQELFEETELVEEIDVDNTIHNQESEQQFPPTLANNTDLHTLDNPLYNGMDEEAIDMLIQYKLRKLWNNTLNGLTNIDNLKQQTGSTYFTRIKDLFLEEYNEVNEYTPPTGYSFKHQPNLMQKLTVNRLLKNKSYGNWSGTGAGKTLSFIMASRELQSKLTLVIALNSTISELCKVIKCVYPDSKVFTEYQEDYLFDRNNNNFLILNYEKFQQDNSERLFQSLTNNNQIDFVVIDEVHNAKQRTEELESLRRQVLVRLLGRIRENNSNSHTLAMSATPVINNLYEAKSLLELLTGDNYDELNTTRTITNAINMFKHLTLNGIRFIPKYDIDIAELTSKELSNLNIDGSHLLDKLLNLQTSEPSIIEKLLLDDKLNSIQSYLRKGVIIYSYYTTGIVNRIEEFIKERGFIVGTYTGDESTTLREDNLKKFINGEIDILIGSRPIGTGVDGLQSVCNRMIPIILPWTDAEYTQLKGRIYRQGSLFQEVEIILPQVKIQLEDGNIWSWDIQRLNLIRNKRTLADAAVDGYIPSRVLPSKEAFTRKSIESLRNWKDRIQTNNIVTTDREKLSIELYPEIQDGITREQRILSELSTFNQRGKITRSSTMNKEFNDNPESWFRYHKLRRSRMESWEEIPYEYIATKIKYINDIVVDFGCGDNKFKDCIPNNKVISIDHIACDNNVIACDMSDISNYVNNESVDVTVFSLSLWGTNYKDYIKEAYRVLKPKGIIYISEPSKYYETSEDILELTKLITEIGFQQIGNIENRGKFIYITGIKI